MEIGKRSTPSRFRQGVHAAVCGTSQAGGGAGAGGCRLRVSYVGPKDAPGDRGQVLAVAAALRVASVVRSKILTKNADKASPDPLPVSFRRSCYNFLYYTVVLLCDIDISRRWDVAPLTSQRTCTYHPNASDLSSDTLTKRVSFGGVYTGNYHKVPFNDVVSVLWEAMNLVGRIDLPSTMNVISKSTNAVEVESSSSPAKILPLKPKLWLLASVVIEPGTAVQLA